MGSINKPRRVTEQMIERAVLRRLREMLPGVIHDAVHSVVEPETPAPVGQPRQATRQGTCRAVWGKLDELSQQERPTVRQILQVATSQGWNADTTRSQYYRWRKAHPTK